MPNTPDSLAPSRTWLLAGGVLSILAGVCAIAAPTVFTYVITQFLGALLLVTGVVGLFQAIFGKNTTHRVLSFLSAVVRAAAGSALFFFTLGGMATLTLLLAAVFVAEGIFCIVASFRLRANSAWIWLLLNGVVAIILGGMIYAQWPLDSQWAIGVLFGIQSLFNGAALLLLGLKARQS
jgi:uncharacterized membrane protein HdeD (DUF308 family)